MPVRAIPDSYRRVTPYLIVGGVAGVIDFLKQTFDAEEVHPRMSRPDGAIMHAEVKIGDSILMMGEPVGMLPAMPGGFYVYVNDTDASYQRALAAGATSVMAPANQFYGDRNAGVKDQAGNIWWIATHQEDVAPEELERRAAARAGAHSSAGAA